ncbi:MAG: tRNA 2-thiouridine(34) synthase MnmA [Syntrophobacterales bacterium]|nr:tRNA 2-thiouridine(34) synthase MnmA [Syntrophobacterales bacterium]
MAEVVVVAFSGGVDSALAAHLLREQGWEVWAVFLRLTEAAEGAGRAAHLARALGLPLVEVDLRQEFEAAVVQEFVRGYARGLTPNPCVACNARIKFGVLWQRVQAFGARYLATGHYVRRRPAPEGGYGLCRGADRSKDQSYFLQRLPREILPQVLFPLGELTKEEVRRRFQGLGLPEVELPPESQEVCFIPPEGYREFLRRAGVAAPPGEIVDTQGRYWGRHQGLIAYTVGQRRGLGLAAREPLYVLKLCPETNRLVVGPKAELFAPGLRAVAPNWLTEPPAGDGEAVAVIRYRHPGVRARLRQEKDGSLTVAFAQPQAAVAPGQAVAFYEGERLLGGAWIAEPLREGEI